LKKLLNCELINKGKDMEEVLHASEHSDTKDLRWAQGWLCCSNAKKPGVAGA
jgi:hypothetical protein